MHYACCAIICCLTDFFLCADFVIADVALLLCRADPAVSEPGGRIDPRAWRWDWFGWRLDCSWAADPRGEGEADDRLPAERGQGHMGGAPPLPGGGQESNAFQSEVFIRLIDSTYFTYFCCFALVVFEAAAATEWPH